MSPFSTGFHTGFSAGAPTLDDRLHAIPQLDLTMQT